MYPILHDFEIDLWCEVSFKHFHLIFEKKRDLKFRIEKFLPQSWGSTLFSAEVLLFFGKSRLKT
jgi:hypothetical protein